MLEEEAGRGRSGLAAQLEKVAPEDRRARAAVESACAMEALRLQLADQEVKVKKVVDFLDNIVTIAAVLFGKSEVR